MNRKIEKWKLADLKPHPRQAELFSNLNKQEKQALAEDMKKNGQLVPAEILPDGTLICGHQRVEVARANGWTEIDVWVRHDLAAAGDAAVELRLIEDNVNRRQLDKLNLARCYERERELVANLPEHLRPRHKGDLRDVIARKLGLSGRTLDRYRLAGRAPKPIREACSRGEISVEAAAKVAKLAEKEQASILEAIAGGKPVKEAVKAALKKQSTGKPVTKSLQELIGSLSQGKRELGERLKEIRRITPPDLVRLKDGEAFLKLLIAHAEKLQQS